MKNKFTIVVIFASCLASNAFAAKLYGTEFSGALYQIDSTNGLHTAVGSVTDPNSPGLAYDSATGTMYSISTNGLYSIDLADATRSYIGGFSSSLTGLTHSGNSSTLYAAGYNGLYSIDTSTGSASFVGSFGGGIDNLNGIIDLATDSNGDLFGMGLSGLLYNINESTGSATLLGGISGLTGGSAGGHGITAISFDENDMLFGINTVPDSLITIDINSLTYAIVGGDIGSDVRGMAFAIEASVVPVPAAAWLFGTGLLGLIGMARRKKV